ncbi:MAG TPA: trehalose-6-phosphate synthase [Deltaproteobacteria bacterium]|nr:trehalose-6-phosphate synthase [Deltaproteobacteria bacterium]
MAANRLVVVSNRLPVVLSRSNDDGWSIQSGSGGLVTAMGPVLRDRGGLWIGWPGIATEDCPDEGRLDNLIREGAGQSGYALKYVYLNKNEIDMYYYGFSNEILWPLFHDLFSNCNFDPRYWDVYQKANQKFARSVIEHTDDDDYIWVHDYHLILVARELRKSRMYCQVGFFLHVPFPPLDIFLKLPWRFEILQALLEYDLLGFQTFRDRRNFLDCVRALHKCRITGRGQVMNIAMPDHEVRVGAFPISIDYKEFADFACSQEVADQAWIIHENLPRRQLVLGVDRLDYTKGIPERLQAFDDALARYPQLRRKIALIQVVVPSRRDVEEYERLKQEIERLVGEINGRYTEVGWTPVHYIFRSLSRRELVAYYRTCEIALITPLKDGMNLVAKEYCASSVDENCVLILSEFAGAAAQLYPNAILVNPYDMQGVADAIYEAFTMAQEKRRERMRNLRSQIRKNDIINWVNSFLKAGIAKNLSDFPHMELFVPKQ